MNSSNSSNPTTLRSKLGQIVRDERRYRQWRALARWWLIASVAGIAVLTIVWVTDWRSPALWWVVGGFALAGAGMSWWRERGEHDHRWVVARIEREHPQLKALLMTASEQEPDAATGTLTYLQERVILEAIDQERRSPWVQRMIERLFFAQCAQFVTLLVFLGVLAGLYLPTPDAVTNRFAASAGGVAVTPGDTEIERGAGLVVLARFDGEVPGEATLVVSEAGETSRTVAMQRNLDDPVFGGSIAEVRQDLTYRLEYGGRQTRPFQVTVFEYPKLERADARVDFPEYTGLEPRKIEDVRRVGAVEGAQLTLDFRFNKPVASASLVGSDESVIPLVLDEGQAAGSLADFQVTRSETYKVILADADGRTNKVPAQLVIEAQENRRPEIKLAAPRGDQEVSALEEVRFLGEVWDDFGILGYGMTYTIAGRDPVDLMLGGSVPAREKQALAHLLKLETLGLETDQLVSYYLWAEDHGPDGGVRRSYSDMYFAEVRPFDEIFRQGQSMEDQSGQQQQQQQQGRNRGEELVELQKEIINATWNLQRQHGGREATAPYREDAAVVLESQEQALSQARAMESQAADPQARVLIQQAVEKMASAAEHLKDAVESPSVLPDALAAEQSAYQALLRLQAHEYNVSRGGGGGGGGGGGQRSQRQLDQLDVSEAANRYQTQSQAAARQTPEQREDLQVLNRLKELAQRQQDINERLKELQTALQEARTEEERRELERELRRLREEERELLANVDELQQRMERPENQSRMAEARQQLEETRSQVQQAADALEEESVSEALASGTRAGRQFEELRDEFRRQTSSQFAEELREMRREVRELSNRQEQIARSLENPDAEGPRSLSGTEAFGPTLERLETQRRQVSQLLEDMREVSEQSEASEPLLSKQLYDTLRRTDQADSAESVLSRPLYEALADPDQTHLENTLDISAELLRRGFVPVTRQLEPLARESINRLREGIESAAESVLGDETEALRLAQSELDRLGGQVQEEVNQATGGRSESGETGQSGTEQTSDGQPGGTSPWNRDGTNEVSVASGNTGEARQRSDAGEPGESGEGQETGEGGRRAEAGEAGESPEAGGEGTGQEGNPQVAEGGQEGSPGESADGEGTESSRTAQAGQSGEPGQPGQSGGSGQEGQSGQPNTPGDRPGQGGAEGGEGQPQLAQSGEGGQSGPRGNGGGGSAGGPDRGWGGGARFFDQGGDPGGPLTGQDFREWADRLREVEEMVDITELSREVSRVRDRATAIRAEFTRNGKEPQWEMVQTEIVEPLAQVRTRIAEELARRESRESLVPVDRDPVPSRYSELVRRYYERLGAEE